MRPGDPRRWLLISREKGIAEAAGEGARWAVDHLLVDQDARPTLAEVKRRWNPEIRRTIIGQLHEYAAHASETWTAKELRETFEHSAKNRNSDPQEELAALLQTGTETNPDAFWDNVATNLAANRLRLLFISDRIPDELARVVTFLNEQMANIEVLAIEIRRFQGGTNQTLVPRVSRKNDTRGQGQTRTRWCTAHARIVPRRLRRRACACRGAGLPRRSARSRCQDRVLEIIRSEHPRAVRGRLPTHQCRVAVLKGGHRLDAHTRLQFRHRALRARTTRRQTLTR